jgi:flagellum-specific ATP synthase
MTEAKDVQAVIQQIRNIKAATPIGRVTRVESGVVHASGLGGSARIGDWAKIYLQTGDILSGEIVQLIDKNVIILPDDTLDGIALNNRIALGEPGQIFPSNHWIGRIIDANGQPLDGRPLSFGSEVQNLRAHPPKAATRKPLGNRLETGLAITNTLLPIAQGQRVGLFAGSGVGKSTLLGTLATQMKSDVVVIAMIGERGRELRHFVDNVLGEYGLKRAVIVAATSDQSPLLRRRCAWTAMAVAEYFRDQGKSVLFLADSITRFAEAHREVAVAAGEAPVLRGHPPSTAHLIMQLCERAGPGQDDQGDITAIFSVLVAGSDMEEPIADILRGVLDGHIVLEREIAERGRFPAIDLLRSVSRCLPAAATEAQNKTIQEVRRITSTYEHNATMIQAGLYSPGSDQNIDLAIALWPALEAFLGSHDSGEISQSFNQLELLLRRTKAAAKLSGPAKSAT